MEKQKLDLDFFIDKVVEADVDVVGFGAARALAFYQSNLTPHVPGWVERESDGRPKIVGLAEEVHICPNSPHRRWKLDVIREVAENYEVDAMYFDGPSYYAYCYCPYCKERARKERIDRLCAVCKYRLRFSRLRLEGEEFPFIVFLNHLP